MEKWQQESAAVVKSGDLWCFLTVITPCVSASNTILFCMTSRDPGPKGCLPSQGTKKDAKQMWWRQKEHGNNSLQHKVRKGCGHSHCESQWLKVCLVAPATAWELGAGSFLGFPHLGYFLLFPSDKVPIWTSLLPLRAQLRVCTENYSVPWQPPPSWQWHQQGSWQHSGAFESSPDRSPPQHRP